MKWIQSLFVLFFSILLLFTLWPLLLVFLAVIAYQLLKARRLVKQAFQETPQASKNNDFETFRQDTSGDVIDANYTERSPSDGPQ